MDPSGDTTTLTAHLGSQVRTVPISHDGTWTFVFHAAALPDGPTQIRLVATDAQALSGETAITVQIGAPPPPTEPSAKILAGRATSATPTANAGAISFVTVMLAALVAGAIGHRRRMG